MFRYGIEHELALLRADGRFADFTDVAFTELQDVVDGLPEDPSDYPGLRIGDVGIKHKRWYVEGYERFDEAGALLRCDPKGLEIRTRIHDSVDAAVAALRADQELLDAALVGRDLRTTVIAFNPVRTEYVVQPSLNTWEQAHRQGSPEERTAHLHMLTYGPDLNLSSDEIADPVASRASSRTTARGWCRCRSPRRSAAARRGAASPRARTCGPGPGRPCWSSSTPRQRRSRAIRR